MIDPETSPGTPDPAPSRGSRWQALKPHLVALFVTFHLGCVLFYLLPYPPRMDRRTLNLPDVKEEIDRSVRTIHRLIRYDGTEAQLEQTLLDWIRAYTQRYLGLRSYVGYYLEAVGSTQTWNMFGGTPPRHPRVIMVEIQPRGTSAFVLYQDGHWLTPADYEMHFRHRKAQERLSVGGRPKAIEHYAAWWARRWNADYPNRPAGVVRLSYAQLNTPSIKEIKKGRRPRKEERVNPIEWTVPEGGTP